MKVFRNIYGVYGMVEWSTLIPTGGSNLRIDFTNGSISSRGIDPATFTTDIPAVQTAIENSPKYKSGKIKKVKSFLIGEVPDEVVVTKKEEKVRSSKGGSGDDTANASNAIANAGAGSAAENGGNANPENDNSVGANAGDENGEGDKYSEVKNSQQAKAILMAEPYNIPLADLGNKQAILDKAAELNVVFSNWK